MDTQEEPRISINVSKAIATHVRALRLIRGWSLDGLAVRSGVSKGMLVQVEGARTNPSVGTLCRIADAFGVTVGRLLEPFSERDVQVSPANSAPLLWRGGYGGFARLLGRLGDPELTELREWVLQPKDRYQAADQFPGTRELLHVLVGEVRVTVGGAEHKVAQGETIDLPTDRGRVYRNTSEAPCRLVQVRAWAPSEREHVPA